MRNDDGGGQYFACVADWRRADATLHLQDCAWRISLLLSCWGAVWVSKFIYLALLNESGCRLQVSQRNNTYKARSDFTQN